MSLKKSASYYLTQPERRRRRNLSDFPGVKFSGINAPPTDSGTCPNIGPADAGAERCTPQDTGTQEGTPYLDAELAGKAIPGQDVISYCYDVRVGPGTGPIDCYCDGHIGLITDGLLFDSGYGFPNDNWKDRIDVVGQVSFYRKQDVDGFWWLETTGLAQIGFDSYWYITPKNGVSKQSDEMLVTAQIWGLGLGYVAGGGTVEECWYCNADIISRGCSGHRGHAGLMACRHNGLFGWAGQDWHAHGIFGCTESDGIALWDDPVTTPVQGDSDNAYFGDPSVWKQNSSSDTNTVRQRDTAGGAWEHTSTNTVYDGVSGDIAIYNWLHSGEGGGFRIKCFSSCTSRLIKMQGLPTGYWVRMTGVQRPVRITPTLYFDAEESSGVATIDLEGQHPPYTTWQIWDGEPAVGGSTLILECDIPRGIWGGDVFEYFPAGDCSDAEVVADVEGYIQMEVLDVSDTVLDTIIPTEVGNTTGWVRKNGVLGYGLPGNAHKLRFTPVKTGTADAWACFQKLQVNLDAICCAYSDPALADCCAEFSQSIHYPADLAVVQGDAADALGVSGERFIQTVFDTDRADFWTGGEIGDSYYEHRNAPINLMGFDGHDERNGPPDGGAGNPPYGKGYSYTPIDGDDFGLIAGEDTISIRFKGRAV